MFWGVCARNVSRFTAFGYTHFSTFDGKMIPPVTPRLYFDPTPLSLSYVSQYFLS